MTVDIFPFLFWYFLLKKHFFVVFSKKYLFLRSQIADDFLGRKRGENILLKKGIGLCLAIEKIRSLKIAYKRKVKCSRELRELDFVSCT